MPIEMLDTFGAQVQLFKRNLQNARNRLNLVPDTGYVDGERHYLRGTQLASPYLVAKKLNRSAKSTYNVIVSHELFRYNFLAYNSSTKFLCKETFNSRHSDDLLCQYLSQDNIVNIYRKIILTNYSFLMFLTNGMMVSLLHRTSTKEEG